MKYSPRRISILYGICLFCIGFGCAMASIGVVSLHYSPSPVVPMPVSTPTPPCCPPPPPGVFSPFLRD